MAKTIKEIDLNKNLFELTEQHPELIEILVGLGFMGVGNPALRSSHGKIMTIPKGCQAMGLDLKEIVRHLEKAGFKVLS